LLKIVAQLRFKESCCTFSITMNYKFVAALVALVKAEGFNEMLQNGGVCKDIQKER